MKLIIAGATGFVATECVRQALKDSRFTSVIALARRQVKVPTDLGSKADTSKLQSVVLEDYGSYPEDVKKQLAGADACIWTVAITPAKSKKYDWSEVTRVCRDNALAGFQVVVDARGGTWAGASSIHIHERYSRRAGSNQIASADERDGSDASTSFLSTRKSVKEKLISRARAKPKQPFSTLQPSIPGQWRRAAQSPA